MKNLYYYLLILCFIFPILLSAQEYVPFRLDDSVSWHDYSFYGSGDPPGSAGGTTIAYSYLLDGDTLVNGHTYKKVYSREDWFYRRSLFYAGPDMLIEEIDEENYDNPYLLFGGLRQDTAAKTLYYVNLWEDIGTYQSRCFGIVPEVGEEQLLYDFSLQEGDTMQTVYGSAVVVSRWDFTLEDGSERNAMQLDGYDPMIEGIGGIDLGLFAPWIYHPFESGCGFYCYREMEEVLLRGWGLFATPSNLNETCDALIISAEELSEEASFTVLPNPTHDQFVIEPPSTLRFQRTAVSVYNNLGQQVFQTEAHDFVQPIDASQWPAGMYFLMVEVDGGLVWSTKVLKVGG